MKFLDRLVDTYAKLEVERPQWVAEYVAPVVSMATPSTPSSLSTSASNKFPELGKAIDDTLQVKTDPDLEKKKQELDTVYKQVADILKKKAADATNKLKQTSTNITATPSTTPPVAGV
jgi:hypothetical protein